MQMYNLGPELVEHLRGPILLLPKFPELEGKARLADVLQLGRVHARRGLSGTGALVLGAAKSRLELRPFLSGRASKPRV